MKPILIVMMLCLSLTFVGAAEAGPGAGCEGSALPDVMCQRQGRTCLIHWDALNHPFDLCPL